jgi:acyl-CoA thioesterase
VSSEAEPGGAFASLLERVPQTLVDGRPVTVEIPPAWSQGRSSFGGALAGLGLAAMAAIVRGGQAGADPAEHRRCRSLQVNFIGPVAAGPVDLHASQLRHGRSATQVQAILSQAGQVGCLLQASFASPRPSAIAVPGPVRPELRGPEGLVALPFIPGLVPEFTRAFELRWAEGGPPGAGLAETHARGWARFRERRVGVGPAWIAALVDAWPAPVLQTLRKPAVASSLSWSIDFVDLREIEPDAASDAWWAFAVETDHAADGWAFTRARLWSPGGRLAAVSSQAVAVFA